MTTSGVRGKNNVSMHRRVNEQQTDRVDIKRRDRGSMNDRLTVMILNGAMETL